MLKLPIVVRGFLILVLILVWSDGSALAARSKKSSKKSQRISKAKRKYRPSLTKKRFATAPMVAPSQPAVVNPPPAAPPPGWEDKGSVESPKEAPSGEIPSGLPGPRPLRAGGGSRLPSALPQ